MLTLTVILCNYNHARYLRTALEAITSQSVLPDELIIIDDASTDGSRDIINEYAAKYSFVARIFNERNSGVITNANRGLSLARGEYVFFAAADDFILPGFIEKLMGVAEQYPHAGLATSYFAFVREGDDQSKLSIETLPFGEYDRYLPPRALVQAHRLQPFQIGGHASLIRRDAALEAGGLIPELHWHCDWFMNQVAAFRYGVAYVPEALSVMRASATTYSGKNFESWDTQRPVMIALANLLSTSRFADVRKAFVESRILAIFGFFFVRAAFLNRNAFRLIRPTMLSYSFLNVLRRMHFNKVIPQRVLSWWRVRAKSRVRDVISSLDSLKE